MDVVGGLLPLRVELRDLAGMAAILGAKEAGQSMSTMSLFKKIKKCQSLPLSLSLSLSSPPILLSLESPHAQELSGEREPNPGVACAPEVAAPCAAGGGPPAVASVRRCLFCHRRLVVRPLPVSKTATPPQPQSTKLGVDTRGEAMHPVHGKFTSEF